MPEPAPSSSNPFYENFKDLLEFLQDRALSRPHRQIFRGHARSEYRLTTTMDRYFSMEYENWELRNEMMLDRFRDSLIREGIAHPDTNDIMDWLEFGRHYGVPSPLLDFSWSPHVALYFAFTRISREREDDERVALYAIDVENLATRWAETDCPGDTEARNRFLYPGSSQFKSGIPENTLAFVPYPGARASRMQRQYGACIFSTLHYKRRKVTDMEEYLSRLENGVRDKIFEKVEAPVGMAREVLTHLELVGVSGSTLFRTAEGAADDIWNEFRYQRKFHLRESPLVEHATKGVQAKRNSSESPH